MKMTKLMAALVVVTIMMTSVVFGATTATTTAYDLESNTFDVQTLVTGANNATKLTYVLYNGTTPDENTIKYIDQKDGESSYKFIVNDIAVADFVGAAIIANDDVTDTADTKPVGNYYELAAGTIANIETMTITCDGSVTYLVAGKSTYLPVGKAATIEVFPVAGHALDADSVSEGSVNGNIITLSGEYDVDATVTLDAAATAATPGAFVSIDGTPVKDVENNTVTFIISTSGLSFDEIKQVGLSVNITGVGFKATMEDMKPALTDEYSTVKSFGIQISADSAYDLSTSTFETSILFNGTAAEKVADYYVVK